MHKPQRQCAACRRMFPKSELLRVAVEKGGEPVVDMTGKMPGRGAYLCRSKKCLQDAEKKDTVQIFTLFRFTVCLP